MTSLPARYGRRTLIALACIAVLGLGLRAVAVVHPVADPADDSHAYYALAKSLYEEGSYGGPGTPVSLTFLGQLYGEAQLLSLARAYQNATGFHLEHPRLGA